MVFKGNVLCLGTMLGVSVGKCYAGGIIFVDTWGGGSFPVGCVRWCFNGLRKDSSRRMHLRGMSLHVVVLRAMYSASVVLRAISDCNLLLH
jgi:hypothetical protein